MDKLQREMIKKYTVLRGFEGVFTVHLQVENQYFCCVTPEPYETREEAEQMQEFLGLALARIVREQAGK